jgi:hypothetical protein
LAAIVAIKELSRYWLRKVFLKMHVGGSVLRIMGVTIIWVLETCVASLEQRSVADFGVDVKIFVPADLGVC